MHTTSPRSMKYGGSKTGFHWNYKVSSRSESSSQECVKDTPHGQVSPGVKVTWPSHVCPPDVAVGSCGEEDE